MELDIPLKNPQLANESSMNSPVVSISSDISEDLISKKKNKKVSLKSFTNPDNIFLFGRFSIVQRTFFLQIGDFPQKFVLKRCTSIFCILQLLKMNFRVCYKNPSFFNSSWIQKKK